MFAMVTSRESTKIQLAVPEANRATASPAQKRLKQRKAQQQEKLAYLRMTAPKTKPVTSWTVAKSLAKEGPQ